MNANNQSTQANQKWSKTIPIYLVHVSTKKFVAAHNKNPRGKGRWAFEIGGEQFFQWGDFSSASHFAKVFAAGRGISNVEVLP